MGSLINLFYRSKLSFYESFPLASKASLIFFMLVMNVLLGYFLNHSDDSHTCSGDFWWRPKVSSLNSLMSNAFALLFHHASYFGLFSKSVSCGFKRHWIMSSLFPLQTILELLCKGGELSQTHCDKYHNWQEKQNLFLATV